MSKRGAWNGDAVALGFGEAFGALREGNRVLRKGWNGKGMWIEVREEQPQAPGTDTEMGHPFLIIKGTDGLLASWAPSQVDLFAQDWEVFCDECSNTGYYFIDRVKTPCGACAETRT